MTRNMILGTAAIVAAALLSPATSFASTGAGIDQLLVNIQTGAVSTEAGSFEIAKRGRGGDTPRWEWRNDSKPTDSGNKGWNRNG